MSKVFERILDKQIDTFMTAKFLIIYVVLEKIITLHIRSWKWKRPGKNIWIKEKK